VTRELFGIVNTWRISRIYA